MQQEKDIMQLLNNSSLDAETKQAIELLIARVLGKPNDIHIKTQEIGDDFLANCRDRKLSSETIVSYVYPIKQLVKLSKEFPPEPEVIQGFLRSSTPYKASAYYRVWHALGNYIKKQYKIPNFMDKVIRPKVPKQIMPTISRAELERLAVLLEKAKPRDKAILSLFVDTAIRKGEACNLKRNDILDDKIVVKGKTGFRVAPISPIIRDLLLSLPTHKDGFVFHGQGQQGKPMGATGFYKIVRKYLRAVGYTKKQPSPQMLRRSFGVFHLKDGGDLKSLSLILGHADITTTAEAYTPLLEQDVIEIHHRHTPGRVFEDVNNQRLQTWIK